MVPQPSTAVSKTASGPVSGVNNVGIRRSEIKQGKRVQNNRSMTLLCYFIIGVREVVLCKDQKGVCGISFHAESKGVFVCFVMKGSPAAMAGVRFGDQILSINGEVVAGYSVDKVKKLVKKAPSDRISLAVRDR